MVREVRFGDKAPVLVHRDRKGAGFLSYCLEWQQEDVKDVMRLFRRFP